MFASAEKTCPVCKCNFLSREVTPEDDSVKCKSCHKLYPDGVGEQSKEETTKLYLGREEVAEMIKSATDALKDEVLCILVSEKETAKEAVVDKVADDEGSDQDELNLDEVEETESK